MRVGREVIEAATFRADFDESAGDPDHVRVDGRIVRDNVYGTLEEDAWRRDFTVNCLYYDHRDRAVVDFTGGYADVRDRTLRLIGPATERYREDPVRMLRAVRFAGKLGFDIEGETSRAIYDLAPLIEGMPPARLYEEVIKLFMAGAGRTNFELLRRFGLFGHLFPETDACIEAEPDGVAFALASKALESTDGRIQSGKPVTPGFLFAALLWEPVLHDSEACTARGMSDIQAYDAAGDVGPGHARRRALRPRRRGRDDGRRRFPLHRGRRANRGGQDHARQAALPKASAARPCWRRRRRTRSSRASTRTPG